MSKIRRKTDIRIIYNKILGGWFIVRGPHQTPLAGRYDTKAAARAWLDRPLSTRKISQ